MSDYNEFEAYLRSRPAVSMQSFIRGQRARLAQLSDHTRQFVVQIALSSGRVAVFDFVCFGIDASGQLSDDRYMVFFNQKRSPDDAIVLLELGDQSAKFAFDLDLVPPTISRLVFSVSVDGAGTMADLSSGSLYLGEAGILSPQVLAEYRFSGADFKAESALMLAEIYRKDGQWRFWAQGQGFEGNLAALLRHFGGQEIEDSAQTASPSPSPSTPIPSRQPSPPVSAPALASVTSSPVVSLPFSADSSAPNALQKAIDEAPSGGTLKLSRGEFQGPVLVDKPLVLEGGGATIWAHNGPVVRVSSAGVTLRDLEIEATAPEAIPHADVALWIDEAAQPVLEKVRVRGEIVGVTAVQGEWKLPPSLNLGEFAAREANSFAMEIEVPHACDLKTGVVGVSFAPPRVEAGRSHLEVRVSGVGNDIFLAGQIELWSGGIARIVPLHGRSTSAAPPARGVWLWPEQSKSSLL